MNKLAYTITAVSLLGACLVAQDAAGRQGRQGRQGGRRQFSMARFTGPMLAPAADANHDGEVTSKEWTAFIKSVSNKEGGIEITKVKVTVFGSMLDMNNDKKVNGADFEAMWKSLDTDGDGKLAAEELNPRPRFGRRGGNQQGGQGRRRRGGDQGGDQDTGGRQRRGNQGGDQGGDQAGRRQARQGRQAGNRRGGNRNQQAVVHMIAVTADVDKNGEVTGAEWKKLVASITTKEGEIKSADLAAMAFKAAKAAQPAEADTPRGGGNRGGRRGRGFGRGNMFDSIERRLDTDRDGSVTKADLEQIFTEVDQNEDGVWQKDELTMRRGGFRRGR